MRFSYHGLHRTKIYAYQASWLILVLIVLSLTSWLGWQNGLGRVDQTFYDHIITSDEREPHKDILMIAIDERSLTLLGPHPWHRNLHAELLRRISEDKPRAVGLNLVLSNPDLQYPNHDIELAEAIRENGRVVLPMRMDGGYSGDSLIQILPLPIFYEAASAIGNIHLISDFDGIVRSVFLRDQIGTETWERFAVKMLQVGGDTTPLNDLPGLRFLHTHVDTKANIWLSDHRMQIPFAGPPGKIPRVSYIDVLHNQVPQNTFRNKYVLVGITAAGMGGDAYPTPVSTDGHAMSGTEITANIMDALLQGITLEPVTPLANTLFSLLPVSGLLLSLVWLSPRRALLFCLFLIVLTLGTSYLIVRVGGYWYPPAAALFGLILTYPLWSWQRLEAALAYLSEEFERLNHESKIFPNLFIPTTGDILDQHIAALTHAAQHLRNLRRLILDSMESLPDATLITDAYGNIVLSNHCAADYFGVSGVDALHGKKLVHLLTEIQPITAQAVCDPEHGLPLVQSTDGVEAIDARGNEFLVKCVPCSNNANFQVGWIVSLVDITSIRQAERKRDEVMRFLSHDMRAPQTSILALLDLYRDDPSVMSETELFNRLGKCARKTLNLADDFIQLDRAESHQYYFEEADLSQLMLDAIDDCWAAAHAKNIRIYNDIPTHPAVVRADRMLLTRAIYNLLGNAIKYSPENSEIWCAVTWQEIKDKQFLQMTICDQGPGIPKEHHPYFFKRYQRFHTDSQPTIEGTGLGLVFVKTVLTHHAGEVGFHSTPGEGCTFYFVLPALERTDMQMSEDTRPSQDSR